MPLNRAPTVYTCAQLITPQDVANTERNEPSEARRLRAYIQLARTRAGVTERTPDAMVRHLMPTLGEIVDHLADLGLDRFRSRHRSARPVAA